MNWNHRRFDLQSMEYQRRFRQGVQLACRGKYGFINDLTICVDALELAAHKHGFPVQYLN